MCECVRGHAPGVREHDVIPNVFVSIWITNHAQSWNSEGACRVMRAYDQRRIEQASKCHLDHKPELDPAVIADVPLDVLV